jgi:hypothetical protein
MPPRAAPPDQAASPKFDHSSIKIALGLAAVAVLSGCVEDMASVESAQVGPPFITTFDPSVSNAAVGACRDALDAQTDGAVEIAGSEYSEANTAIYMRVGADSAPWRCLVSNDGVGPELMFMGSEGAA